MLRAIRFSGTLHFAIDPATLQAVADHADELHVVSAERIAAEMRRVLVHQNTSTSLEQLRETGLWRTVLPEYAERGAKVATTDMLIEMLPAWLAAHITGSYTTPPEMIDLA